MIEWNSAWPIANGVNFVLTLMSSTGGLFGQLIQNDVKNPEKWLKPWHIGTHLRVLSESYPMKTNMASDWAGFRCFLNIFASLFLGWK